MKTATPRQSALRLVVLAALLAAGLASGAVQAQPRAPIFAPYAYVRVGPDLSTWAKATGIKATGTKATGAKRVVLAFYNSDGTGCAGAWPTDEAALIAEVAAFRALGGEVILSSGGWNADDLAARCPDPKSLAKVYLAALDRLGVKNLDLDPEAAPNHDNLVPAVVDRRSAAVKLMQEAFTKRGQTLEVSFTLPATPTQGLDDRALYVLRSALKAGVRFDLVQPMVMNYHQGPSPLTMGDRAVATLEKVRTQLQSLIPGRADADLWRMMGAVAMIGRNDAPDETFTLADARQLTAYARKRGLGRLGFWALSRDNGSCAAAPVQGVACSGLAQDDWAFTRAFQGR
jgi:chitinase